MLPKLNIIPTQAEARAHDTTPVCIADEEESQQDVLDVIDKEESKLRAIGERIVSCTKQAQECKENDVKTRKSSVGCK